MTVLESHGYFKKGALKSVFANVGILAPRHLSTQRKEGEKTWTIVVVKGRDIFHLLSLLLG